MKAKRRREKQSEEAPAWLPRGQFAPQALGAGHSGPGTSSNVKAEAIAMRQEGMQANKNAAKELKVSTYALNHLDYVSIFLHIS